MIEMLVGAGLYFMGFVSGVILMLAIASATRDGGIDE